jgi:hypothetical protein
MDDHKIDVLLKLRKELESEMQVLRDNLAAKSKTMASLNDTIDLLRGWVPADEPPARATYDAPAIVGVIEEVFLSHDDAVPISAILEVLEHRGLIPSVTNAARSRVNMILKTMPGIQRIGWSIHAKYRLVRADAA